MRNRKQPQPRAFRAPKKPKTKGGPTVVGRLAIRPLCVIDEVVGVCRASYVRVTYDSDHRGRVLKLEGDPVRFNRVLSTLRDRALPFEFV